MRTKRYKSLISRLGILAAFVIVMAMIPAQVLAVDTDGDGIPDDLETGPGVVLPPGASSGDPGAVTFLPCSPGDDPATCMDANRIDLFFILRKASPSNIAASPSELVDLITRSYAESGLDFSIHAIDESLAGPDREVYCSAINADGGCVSDGQKAVRITEVTTPALILGFCPQGTPMDGDDCTIYTGEISDFVASTCAGKDICQAYVGEDIDANLVTGAQNIIDEYIELVAIHETGHTIELAVDYNRRFGGNHFKTGTGFIMDQSVVYTDKKGIVTFYFPAGYSAQSQSGALLN